METDGVEGNESGMENSRHNGLKDVGDEHDSFDQEEKDGEHGDDNIVVRDTVQSSLHQTSGREIGEERKRTIGSMVEDSGRACSWHMRRGFDWDCCSIHDPTLPARVWCDTDQARQCHTVPEQQW